MRAIHVLLVLAAGTVLAAARPSAGLELRFREEAGVETRLELVGRAALGISPRVVLGASVAAGVLDNAGLTGYGVDADVRLATPGTLSLSAGVEHEQWNDWRAGENRLYGVLAGELAHRLRFGLGAAWRVPVPDPDRFGSPLRWTSEVAEWNLLYLADWTFLRRSRTEVALRVANYGRLDVHNPQQFPLGVRGETTVGTGWQAEAYLGTAANGLSGPIVSFSELNIRIGVRRDW